MRVMSDFFGALNSGNYRFTDSRINGDGPLPTSLGGPEGINGDPDGRYNFNDSLLSGITPYAFGQGRMGSDRNYQQIPHRKQFPVPPVYLPEPQWDEDKCFAMSHPIDMGDLVFIFNASQKHFLLTGNTSKTLAHGEETTMPNYNVFVNICTVNYILAGISRYFERTVMRLHSHTDQELKAESKSHAWYQLISCMNIDVDLWRLCALVRELHTTASYDEYDQDSKKDVTSLYVSLMLKYTLRNVIRDYIKPIGICATSEKQGGQHETGNKPYQAAASFYVTLTVDGQNRDLVHIWRGVDVAGGDLLTLKLQWVENSEVTYSLNHYYKGWITRSMKFDQCLSTKHCGRFQLKPTVLEFSKPKTKRHKTEACLEKWIEEVGLFLYPVLLDMPSNNPAITDFHKQLQMKLIQPVTNDHDFGYWHVGQAYTHARMSSAAPVPVDDLAMTKGQLLQINFAPVWKGRTTGEFVGNSASFRGLNIAEIAADKSVIAHLHHAITNRLDTPLHNQVTAGTLWDALASDLLLLTLSQNLENRIWVHTMIDAAAHAAAAAANAAAAAGNAARAAGAAFPAAGNAVAQARNAAALIFGQCSQQTVTVAPAPLDAVVNQQTNTRRFKKASYDASSTEVAGVDSSTASAGLLAASLQVAGVDSSTASAGLLAASADISSTENVSAVPSSDWDFEQELNALVQGQELEGPATKKKPKK